MIHHRRPHYLRRGLILHGWVQIGAFFVVMGLACLASGGGAAVVGVFLIVAGFGAFGKAKNEVELDRPRPPIQAAAPQPLPMDPADYLATCLPAMSIDYGGMFAAVVGTRILRIFPSYAQAAEFADSYSGQSAVARVPLLADVIRSGFELFVADPLTAASTVGKRPQATEAERRTWAVKTAAEQTPNQTQVEARATQEAIEVGLRVWPGLYNYLPLACVAAATEWLNYHARCLPAINQAQLAWAILARAELTIATAAFRDRTNAILARHPNPVMASVPASSRPAAAGAPSSTESQSRSDSTAHSPGVS